jgi:hypothetical protein
MSSAFVIVVAGASGGLGTSTLALAVARRLAAAGPSTLVVDLDVGGGGLDVTAGIEHLPGRRWPALADVRGPVDPSELVASLPHEDGCRVLSAGGPSRRRVPQRAVHDVIGSLVEVPGTIVVDAGRRTPPRPVLATTQLLVLLVVALHTRGLADADARLEGLLEATDAAGATPELRLVTRGAQPGNEVLDDVVAHLGITPLGHVADDPRVPRDAERGLWPGGGRDAVRRAADTVVGVVDAVGAAS